MTDFDVVREGLSFHECLNPCPEHEDASAALSRIEAQLAEAHNESTQIAYECKALAAENERLRHIEEAARDVLPYIVGSGGRLAALRSALEEKP